MTLFNDQQLTDSHTILSKILSTTINTTASEIAEDRKRQIIKAFRKVVQFRRRIERTNNRIDFLRTAYFLRKEHITIAPFTIFPILYNHESYIGLFNGISLFENKDTIESELHTAGNLDYSKTYTIKGNKVTNIKIHKNGKVTLYFLNNQAAELFYNFFELETLTTGKEW